MMRNLDAVLVVGIITWGIYHLFELYARRKERLAFIEKLGEIKSFPDMGTLDLSFLKKKDTSFWSLRIALLMIGAGVGWIVAFFVKGIALSKEMMDLLGWHVREEIDLASVAIFGGIGLLIAYLIEQKNKQ